jgi:hypothetical protein
MDLAFAYISEDAGEFYAPDVEIVEASEPPPDLPPEVWQTRPADPQRCWDATRAMCR